MSANNKEHKFIERQLKQLVTCVLQKAENDPEFAAGIAAALSFTSNTHAPALEKPRKISFNSVEFLHRDGRELLGRELNLRTDSELKEIMNLDGIKNLKGLKQFDRGAAISQIITHAERRLSQGSTFLQTASD